MCGAGKPVRRSASVAGSPAVPPKPPDDTTAACAQRLSRRHRSSELRSRPTLRRRPGKGSAARSSCTAPVAASPGAKEDRREPAMAAQGKTCGEATRCWSAHRAHLHNIDTPWLPFLLPRPCLLHPSRCACPSMLVAASPLRRVFVKIQVGATQHKCHAHLLKAARSYLRRIDRRAPALWAKTKPSSASVGHILVV